MSVPRLERDLCLSVAMGFADGKIRLTHVVAALSISDQQEADKLLDESLSCHVCTISDDWMTKAETCRLY